KIKHSGNPLLDVAVNNAILKEDNDAVQIDKRKNREKIDPIAAGMNAYTDAMYYFHEDDLNEYYEGEEFSF
ncbi:terminase TerL endonuclease subunit, partial [Terribacillus saccharophilus]